MKNLWMSDNWMGRTRRKLHALTIHHPEIPVFVITFILLLWLNLAKGSFTFYYDAEIYWDLRFAFNQHETVRFSLLNYNEPLRGYLFPLIHLLIDELADRIGVVDVILLEIVQAFVYSVLICFIIPRGINVLFQHKPDFLQISVFSFLVLLFWQGYFFYPLSDFLAAFLFLCGAYIFVRYNSNWLAALLAGLAWGGAVLVRPAYQITLIPLLLWAVYFYIKKSSLSIYMALARLVAVLIGIGLIFAPQVSINLKHFGIFSYLPQTQLIFGKDLFIQQINGGIVVQKFESNVGKNYPPRVHFFDRQGENLLLDSGFKSSPYSISKQILPDRTLTLAEYFRLVLNYPLDFVSIYARHLFNGLDIVYNTPYIENIFERSIFLRFINYSLWFLVFSYIPSKLKEQRYQISQLFLPFIFALPCLLSIPTAVEVRFMLPIHLMAYALAAFRILPDFVIRDFSQKRRLVFQYLPWYAAFLVVCFTLSENTFMGLEYGNYLSGGK